MKYMRVIKETAKYALYDKLGLAGTYQIWDMTNDDIEPVFECRHIHEAITKFNGLTNPPVYVAYDTKKLTIIKEGKLEDLQMYTTINNVGITNKVSFLYARGMVK